RTARDLAGVAPAQGRPVRFPRRLARVELRLPRESRLVRGQYEAQRLPVRIDQQQQGVVDQRLAMSVELVEGVAGQPEAEGACQWIGPVLFRHLLAVRTEPGEVLHFRAANAAAVEELAAAELRMMLAKPDDLLRELEHVSRVRLEVPIHPGQLVVLAVRIVVALLRAVQLVAVE